MLLCITLKRTEYTMEYVQERMTNYRVLSICPNWLAKDSLFRWIKTHFSRTGYGARLSSTFKMGKTISKFCIMPESLELILQNFSLYFQAESVLANGKHSSIQTKISALITIKNIGEKEYSEILVTESREELHGSLKFAIRNYFGVRIFLANYFLDKTFW